MSSKSKVGAAVLLPSLAVFFLTIDSSRAGEGPSQVKLSESVAAKLQSVCLAKIGKVDGYAFLQQVPRILTDRNYTKRPGDPPHPFIYEFRRVTTDNLVAEWAQKHMTEADADALFSYLHHPLVSTVPDELAQALEKLLDDDLVGNELAVALGLTPDRIQLRTNSKSPFSSELRHAASVDQNTILALRGLAIFDKARNSGRAARAAIDLVSSLHFPDKVDINPNYDFYTSIWIPLFRAISSEATSPTPAREFLQAFAVRVKTQPSIALYAFHGSHYFVSIQEFMNVLKKALIAADADPQTRALADDLLMAIIQEQLKPEHGGPNDHYSNGKDRAQLLAIVGGIFQAAGDLDRAAKYHQIRESLTFH